ncbi:MAG: VWA domain-containing protein, partial [Muribaculaceae bacterium]|nr:VWA domain-containing protein [Muribaculaceae bacterium]
MRRLPVYIVIDVSSSMRGEPIAAVNNGIDTLVQALSSDPYALETTCLSIITYSTEARQIVPLTEVYRFRKPEIIAKGQSAFGAALNLLCECIEREVHKTTADRKGDWRPLVFFLTDGGHSGPIAKPIAEFKKVNCGTVVACATGMKSHFDLLRKITENIIVISSANAGDIKSFFKWVSGSVSTSSMMVSENNQECGVLSWLSPIADNIQ